MTESWRRKSFCGECPRALQPKDGMGVLAFHQHLNSHLMIDLEETIKSCSNYHSRLLEIRRFADSNFSDAWSVEQVRKWIVMVADLALESDK